MLTRLISTQQFTWYAIRLPCWDTKPGPVSYTHLGEMLFDESAFTVDAFRAVGGAARIEAILTDDLDAVHDKERLLREMRDTHLARWRRLADLWVSAWFGNGMSAEEYRDLAGRLQGRPGGLMSDEQAARYLDHPAAAANDYFHWLSLIHI